jgi:hypothetical protein
MEMKIIIFSIEQKKKKKKTKNRSEDAPLIAANFKLARVTFFLLHP